MRLPLAFLLITAACSPAFANDALIRAVQSGDAVSVAAMLKQGVDVNSPEANGTTALHWAVYRQNAALVKRLLAAGANASAVNQFGSTPMQEAALIGLSLIHI